MKSLVSSSLSLIFVAMLSLSASAQTFKYPTVEEDAKGGVTITPMIGRIDLDDGRNMGNSSLTGLGIGYRFSDPYNAEFVYLTGDAESNAGVANGDIRHFRLDMLYDIGDSGNWSPYLSLGAASTEFGTVTNVTDEEGALSMGLGTRYNFSDTIALRGDLRYLRGVGDSKGADVVLGLGLQFFMGKQKKPVKAEPTPVAAAKSEPQVQEVSFSELCAQAGGEVDNGKCIKKSLSQERVTLDVKFATNSDQILSDYLSEVEKLANFMNQYPSSKAVVEGHTDSRGSDDYNQNLSQRRVNEVVRLLSTNYGISAERLTAIGYGETQPVASNDTSENRAKNRRVVAAITVEIEEIVPLTVK